MNPSPDLSPSIHADQPSRRSVLLRGAALSSALLPLPGLLQAQPAAPLKVYGPGGPAPAMREAALAFQQAGGVAVTVTAGPTSQWIEAARADADLVYSGSETMMTDFVAAMQGRLNDEDVVSLYLRPLSILVRPGNPRRIGGLRDLLAPGVKVLVVNGAGQNGAWEDAAGRLGDIRTVRALRQNIVGFAGNSAMARQAWTERQDIDAWLIWNIWQVASPELAEVVPLEEPYRIYRDTGIAPTTAGKQRPEAARFMAFLQSPAGAAVFRRWGWMAG